jgi:hypothetical protein
MPVDGAVASGISLGDFSSDAPAALLDQTTYRALAMNMGGIKFMKR